MIANFRGSLLLRPVCLVRLPPCSCALTQYPTSEAALTVSKIGTQKIYPRPKITCDSQSVSEVPACSRAVQRPDVPRVTLAPWT